MSGSWPWGGFAFGPSRFFETGRRSRFFETGEIRLAILSLLSEGPKHGYQLMKEMAERSGGVYRASAGSVYPTLQQLEDEGLIECTQEGGRRVYRLTGPAARSWPATQRRCAAFGSEPSTMKTGESAWPAWDRMG